MTILEQFFSSEQNDKASEPKQKMTTLRGESYHYRTILNHVNQETLKAGTLNVPDFEPGDIIIDSHSEQKVVITSGEKGKYKGHILNRPDKICAIYIQYDGINWLVQYENSSNDQQTNISAFQVLDI